MEQKMILSAAAVAAILATALPACAEAWHPDRDHHGGPAHPVVVQRASFPHDRIFSITRGHDDHHVGNSYISNDHFVIEVCDQHGQFVLASREPYSGKWFGFAPTQ